MSLKDACALLILGDQLFSIDILKDFKGFKVFMAEDYELCTHERYHKRKILFFLSAMRNFRNNYSQFFNIHYEEFYTLASKTPSYERRLETYLLKNNIKKLHLFEIEDKFFETRIHSLLNRLNIEFIIHPNPSFLCSRKQFQQYLSGAKKPFMKTFYERERKRLNILIDSKGTPIGGKWSFDEDNRKPYKGTPPIPKLQYPKANPITKELQKWVNNEFATHPGSLENFFLPVNHIEARIWLKEFFETRLDSFGTFEDAIISDESLIFHSLLSPLLNSGLLTPNEIITSAIEFAKNNKTSLSSLEGFLRQVMGWREFVRGIYREFSEKQESSNFFNHKRRLNDSWYLGTTGLQPLDDTIKKLNEFGYCHHIERLMILSNIMLLCEIDPRDVHRWFMEKFIDSADWVMGPNVYGMGQFSDGGIFATKPYICGSNYILKMSNYKKGEWCDVMDGLYWRFIENNEKFFATNPRLSMMPRALKKIKPERLNSIKSFAENFIQKVSYLPNNQN